MPTARGAVRPRRAGRARHRDGPARAAHGHTRQLGGGDGRRSSARLLAGAAHRRPGRSDPLQDRPRGRLLRPRPDPDRDGQNTPDRPRLGRGGAPDRLHARAHRLALAYPAPARLIRAPEQPAPGTGRDRAGAEDSLRAPLPGRRRVPTSHRAGAEQGRALACAVALPVLRQAGRGARAKLPGPGEHLLLPGRAAQRRGGLEHAAARRSRRRPARRGTRHPRPRARPHLAAAARPHQPFRAVPLRPGPDAPGLTRVFRRMWPCPRVLVRAGEVAMTLRVRALSEEEGHRLARMTRSQKLGAGLVRRAQIIQHAVDGLSAPGIAARMGLCGATVRFWLKRFNKRGLSGLAQDMRSGRPPTYTAEERSAVIATALSRPAELGLPLEAFTETYAGRTTANWVDFLGGVERWIDDGVERVYAVGDNLNAHSATDVLLFALAHPRWEFVFQPKYAAYLNLIEPWWKILRSLALKGRRFETWAEIEEAIRRATAYWNEHKHPFLWGRRRRHRTPRRPGIAALPNAATT